MSSEIERAVEIARVYLSNHVGEPYPGEVAFARKWLDRALALLRAEGKKGVIEKTHTDVQCIHGGAIPTTGGGCFANRPNAVHPECVIVSLAADGPKAVLPGGEVVDHPDTLIARIFATHNDPDSDPGDLTIAVQDDSALTTVHQERHRKPWGFTPGGSVQEALTNHLSRLTDEEGA